MKIVLVVDPELPLGLIANTAAYLSFSLGQSLENMLAQDAIDSLGRVHMGTSPITMPILKADKELLKSIFEKASQNSDITIMDFTNIAQKHRVYSEYIEEIKDTPIVDLEYLGLALFGAKKAVNSLTGSLPLLR
ncbi:MAG TPA: DUF2000 domain-containing protein [Trueperaceae bacterium]|nr:DUF2000 domain-containing protein [Trueperaceae bacterium]